ncbi:MAG: TonB-dependent receptor, partial [Pseudomonadota bacterium]
MPLSESVIFDRDMETDIDPVNEVEDWGLSASLEIDFEPLTLTSITAYRENDSFDEIDTDQTPLNILAVGANDFRVQTFTQELRLTSNGEGKLDWLVGAFFLDEQIEFDQTITFGPAFRPVFAAAFGGGDPVAGEGLFQLVETLFALPPGSIFGDGRGVMENFDQDNQSWSVFGQLDYHLTDALTATVGLNYTYDEKTLEFSQANNDPFSRTDLSGTPFAGFAAGQFLPAVVGLPNVVEDGEVDDDDVTYTLRLAYQLNDAINLYASYATGFKASSFTIDRGSRPNDADFAALANAGVSLTNLAPGSRLAGPEQAEVWELGFKGRFDRWSLNMALFEQTIEDFQVFTFVQGARFQAANAEQQSTVGFEFDLNWYPVDALELRLAGTLLDPEFDTFTNGSGFRTPGVPEDLSGETPAAIHETSLLFAATYSFQIGAWDAFV